LGHDAIRKRNQRVGGREEGKGSGTHDQIQVKGVKKAIGVGFRLNRNRGRARKNAWEWQWKGKRLRDEPKRHKTNEADNRKEEKCGMGAKGKEEGNWGKKIHNKTGGGREAGERTGTTSIKKIKCITSNRKKSL